MPTPGAPGCPMEERFTSESSEGFNGTIERFMDDKVAIDYYAKDRQPDIGYGGLSERFESQIKNARVGAIKPSNNTRISSGPTI